MWLNVCIGLIIEPLLPLFSSQLFMVLAYGAVCLGEALCAPDSPPWSKSDCEFLDQLGTGPNWAARVCNYM